MAKKADKSRQDDDKSNKKHLVNTSVVQPAAKPASVAPVPIAITLDSKTYQFDIDDPVLPAWIEESALTSG